MKRITQFLFSSCLAAALAFSPAVAAGQVFDELPQLGTLSSDFKPLISDIAIFDANNIDLGSLVYRSAIDTTWNVPVVQGPVQTEGVSARKYEFEHPNSAPVGVNDPTCVPSPEHPNPVILVHGTDSNLYTDYAGFGPVLVERGFCVFGLNYGRKPEFNPTKKITYAWGDIRSSSRQLNEFARNISALYGGQKVDVIGFSQGANVSRWWVNKDGGREITRTWIGLGSPTRGGIFYGLGTLADRYIENKNVAARVLAPALIQQVAGAELMKELNSPRETVIGVNYVTVNTTADEAIQPNDNMPILDGGATNTFIQEICPEDYTGHIGLPYSPIAQTLMLQGLGHDEQMPKCDRVLFGQSIVEDFIQSQS